MGIKISKTAIRKSDFRLLLTLFFIVLTPVFTGQTLRAQSNLNGVYKNYIGVETTGENEFVAARNRLRLSFQKDTDFGGFKSETDLLNNFTDPQEIDLLLREAYLDWYLESHDIRVGKQIVSWGRTNGAFVTDILSPLDLREFLTIPVEDIRLGLTSFNIIRYSGSNSLQFIFAPFEQPDLLPGADSRWFPVDTEPIPIPVETDQSRIESTQNRLQAGIRYSLRSPSRFDLDLMAMRWAHPVPAYDLDLETGGLTELLRLRLTETYKTSWMTGASAQWNPFSSLFFKAEGLYVGNKLFNTLPVTANIPDPENADLSTLISFFQSIDINTDFDGFITDRPWLHAMAGVDFELLDTNISVEGYIEQILDYNDSLLQEERFEYITFTAIRSFLDTRLNVLTLGRYQFDQKDYWIQLQGTYEIRNGFEATLGTNLFAGSTPPLFYGHLSFSNYAGSSFLYSKIAFFF